MYTPSQIELELMAGMAAGDYAATEKIYRNHFGIVSKWIEKNGGQESDAADIFQEAMVVLYEKLQDSSFQLNCAIGTYLFAICKHMWYKKVQQLKKQPSLLDEETDRAYEDDVKVHKERELHYEQLNNALEQIGEPCRSLLKAFYKDSKSMQQIAATFGYTNPENAKTQKYKCLTRLRKIFFSVQAR